MRLEKWFITTDEGPLTDVSVLRDGKIKDARVWGDVYDNPNFPEGGRVRTSCIVELLEGNKVRTYSGSVYELGKVCESVFGHMHNYISVEALFASPLPAFCHPDISSEQSSEPA